MSKSSKEAKKAAMKAFQDASPPKLLTLKDAITDAAESTQRAVRVECRPGGRWIVALGGDVRGETSTECPSKLLADLVKAATE